MSNDEVRPVNEAEFEQLIADVVAEFAAVNEWLTVHPDDIAVYLGKEAER